MYEKFFGFRERPFDLTPNPRFLVWTESHLEALRNLEYGIASRKGITLLIGDAGSGKTTVVRAAIDRRPSQVHCSHITNPTLSRAEFNETLADTFGLSPRARASKASMLTELEELLTIRHESGESTVLVLDEAQSMPLDLLEEIRLLANTETNAEKLVTIVMAGQPELADRLNEPGLRQLKQRVALRCEIRPLTLNETQAYVAGRIGAAGGPKTPLFTEAAVRLMHDASRGLPRTINVIADNALLGAFAEGSSLANEEIVRAVCRDFAIGADRVVQPAGIVPLPHALKRDEPRVLFDIVKDTEPVLHPPVPARYVHQPRSVPERLGFAAAAVIVFGAMILTLRTGIIDPGRFRQAELTAVTPQVGTPVTPPPTRSGLASAPTPPVTTPPPIANPVVRSTPVPEEVPAVPASARQDGGRASAPPAARRIPTSSVALMPERRSTTRVTPAPPPRPAPPAPPPVSVTARAPGPSPTPSTSPPANQLPASTGTANIVATAPLPAVSSPPVPTEPRTPTSSAPPVASAPTPSTPATSAPTAPDTAAIQSVLERYRHAFETLSASGIESVWPAVNTGNLQRAFNQLSEQSIAFDSCTIRVTAAARAAASCGGRTSFVPKVGNRTARSESRQWNFQLSRNGGYWIIDRVETR